MQKIAENLIEKAEDVAREIMRSGESVKMIKFGHENGIIWVSSDRDKLIVEHIFMVDGHEFFIGIFKK